MSFWDRVAVFYDISETINRKVYTAMCQGVKLNVADGARVLDCAAGTGELTVAASGKAESVVCTDLSLPMLEQARKKCARLGIENVRFEERDVFNMTDEDECYDVVMAGNVLHLIDNPQGAVRELYRVTKRGGKLILPTFVLKKTKVQPLLFIYRLFGFRPVSNFTAESYRKMLDGCGLGCVSTTTINGPMSLVFAVIDKN